MLSIYRYTTRRVAPRSRGRAKNGRGITALLGEEAQDAPWEAHKDYKDLSTRPWLLSKDGVHLDKNKFGNKLMQMMLLSMVDKAAA